MEASFPARGIPGIQDSAVEQEMRWRLAHR